MNRRSDVHYPAMRAFGLAVVVLVTSGACGGESKPAASAGPAGEVVSATGDVHATRGGERRALAVGGDVFADDEVETGTSGSIAILLRHNGAMWELGPGARRRVDQSVAWKAAPGSGAGLDGDDPGRTAAAGRHEEPSADDRAAALPAPAAEAAAEPEPAPPPPPGGMALDEGKMGRRSGGGGGAPTKGGGLGIAGDDTGAAVAPKESAPRPRVTQGAPVISGPHDEAVIRRMLRRYQGHMQRCYERVLKVDPSLDLVVRLSFTVTAKGTTAKVEAEVQPANKELRACIAGAVRRFRFPPADGDTSVQVTVRFQRPE